MPVASGEIEVSYDKVVGLGIPKTGTTTLGACFRVLRIDPHQGHRKDLVSKAAEGDIDSVLEEASHYRGFQDTPWCSLFRELDQTFPGSKFVLTTRRDALTRAKSAWNHRLKKGKVRGRAPRKALKARQESYERHNAAVREYFKDRPDDLLEVCWETGDGWRRLCEFLGLPEPDVPFPHKNRGRYPATIGSRAKSVLGWPRSQVVRWSRHWRR